MGQLSWLEVQRPHGLHPMQLHRSPHGCQLALEALPEGPRQARDPLLWGCTDQDVQLQGAGGYSGPFCRVQGGCEPHMCSWRADRMRCHPVRCDPACCGARLLGLSTGTLWHGLHCHREVAAGHAIFKSQAVQGCGTMGSSTHLLLAAMRRQAPPGECQA